MIKDNPYPTNSEKAVIFDLISEDWPGVGTSARHTAVEHAFNVCEPEGEYYSQACIWLDRYVYGR